VLPALAVQGDERVDRLVQRPPLPIELPAHPVLLRRRALLPPQVAAELLAQRLHVRLERRGAPIGGVRLTQHSPATLRAGINNRAATPRFSSTTRSGPA
jgi:hypothetical protein